MLDKNIQKYITVMDRQIIAGQDARTKEWYCKELPCKNVEELDTLINKVNKILNKYNKKGGKESKKNGN